MEYFLDNILDSGSIRASPTDKPDQDYNFHWVRDAAIVIKSVITLYIEDKTNTKFKEIIDKYILTELKHIKHHPAEPKFLLDQTPFLGDWGRPQNDGPAMRGIVCLKLLKLFPNKSHTLLTIIYNDLSYTIDELDQPCFNLWLFLYWS